jgi:hypothetical protein
MDRCVPVPLVWGSIRLFKPRAAQFLIRFVILGAAAGALAGCSAQAMLPGTMALSDTGAQSGTDATVPQTTNRLAKADRLPLLVQAAMRSEGGAGYALAAAPAHAGGDRFYDLMFTAAPSAPNTALAYAVPLAPEPAKPDRKEIVAEIAAVPLPPHRPKQLRVLRPPPQSALLDDTHIASIKARLQLTAEQAEYWPAVEEALRDIARTQLHGHVRRTSGAKPNIDVNSPEVQKLVWAAMPLLMRLREDQKTEVRKLARVIGLDSIASQI